MTQVSERFMLGEVVQRCRDGLVLATPRTCRRIPIVNNSRENQNITAAKSL